MLSRRMQSINPLMLSFLDVLSCGFGAALFLFMIFSAVKGLPEVPSILKSEDFITFQWIADKTSDFRVIVENKKTGAVNDFCFLTLAISRECSSLSRVFKHDTDQKGNLYHFSLSEFDVDTFDDFEFSLRCDFCANTTIRGFIVTHQDSSLDDTSKVIEFKSMQSTQLETLYPFR